MKRLFTFFALLLMGIGISWAECGYVYFDNGMTQSGDVTFTNSNSSPSYQSIYTGTYTLPATFDAASAEHTFSKGLKMQSDDVISFTTKYATTLTVVQSLKREGETDERINLDGELLTNRTTTEDVAIYTYSLSAGTHEISRYKQCGLLFIGVQSDLEQCDGSYPFTWDFKNNDWASTKVQVKYNNYWTVSDEGNARPTIALDNFAITDIDMVKGLKFTTSNAADLCLDWTNKHVWLNGTITIPSVKVGQTITFTGTSLENLTAPSSVSANGDYSYTVTENGDASFTTTSSWIQTISVTNTEVNLSSGGSQTYNYYVDKNSFNHLIVLRDKNTPSTIYKLTSDDLTDITVTSSNTEVFTVGSTTIDSNGRLVVSVNVVGAGTANIIVSFSGNDSYTVLNTPFTTSDFTITKYESTVAFATAGDQTINYSVGTFNNVASATYNNEPTGQTITYTSSDENVATVDANGVVTFVNSGTTTITATAASTDTYEEASASYTLTVQGSKTPTLSWMEDTHLISDDAEITYGNYPYCYAVSSDGRTNITYKSSDENIVKVKTEKITINNEELTACKINPVHTGEATIYANLEGSGSYNPTQVALTVTITQGTTQIAFTPTAGTINAGCTVTPNLSFPNMLADDVTSFTAVSSDPSVATVTSDLKETGSVDGANYLRTVYPVITGVSAGTATITVTFESNLYENVTTTYTVTVVEGDDVNFYWTMNGSATGESKIITINEGDFIMLPAITGMSNGNNSYSDCTNKKYVYGIKNGTVEYNNRKNYKLGEGVPDISVGNESTALVFYAQGQSTAEDSLMVYGRAAGTTYLRATDPQTKNSCSDITLVVKSGLESAHTTAVSGMYFPYTWDFSEMDLDPITNELEATGGEGASWRTYNDTYYMADGIFNADYDDKDNNGNYRQENAKIVSANGEYMKIFNGLKINLAGKDYWKQKHDRLRVAKDGSHIAFIGGLHAIVFPDPTNKPSGTYKLFIKGKGTSSSSTSNFISLTNADQTNADYQFANNKTKIVSFDASDLTNNTIYVQNMQIEWMAFSTQAKKISTVNYATYSEQYDLDFEKTKESQGVQTFAVSSTGDNKAYLTELKYAKDTQGFVIKNSDANKGTATDYYYIAKARNLDEYTDLLGCYDLNGTLIKNMLVASIGSADISTYKSSGDVYFLSNKSFIEDEHGQEIEGTQASYLGFFKAAHNKTHSNAFSAFLHIKPTDNVNAKYFLLSGLYDMDDVAPTSIDNSIVSDEAAGDGVYYNLNGMRVEKPGKGVYVRNGKKVIIK